jgi:hypothetical protein
LEKHLERMSFKNVSSQLSRTETPASSSALSWSFSGNQRGEDHEQKI